MHACDGNNSAKRHVTLGGRTTGDTRVFNDSDYYMSNDYVNSFAHEVPSRRIPVSVDEGYEDDDDWDDEQVDGAVGGATEEGDPTDGSEQATSSLAGCARNWKAALGDSKKKMWGIFEETGVFVGACRHGFVTWLCDMIRSGEL